MIPKTSDSLDETSTVEPSSAGSFDQILNEFEQSHRARGERVDGTVVSVTPDFVFVDIGRKMDGILPRETSPEMKVGDKLIVAIQGRDQEGNYLLSTIRVERPKDWTGLEAAFAQKKTISGQVIEAVKGGLRVDVGVRAFMPASRSGARDQAEIEKLIGQEIECRITKLDTTSEDVVVDRRIVLEERERAAKEQAFARIEEGAVVRGAVRTITDFGAFVDLGGFDGLLHVSDMTWTRGSKPSDIVNVGDQIEVKVLKINRDTRKIALGLKQLAPDPWSQAPEKYQQGARVKGKVVRVADFGAFVELEPGVEGLIHVSEMSWSKKNVRPADILKAGDVVEVAVLQVNPADRRIALGLKQTLGDPWEEAKKKHTVGSAVEAPVTSLAKFGAFVDLGDGIEGMIHIGDISREKRLNHPSDVLKIGEKIKAQVLEIDVERRRFRLGIKQLEPTSIDEYIAEHKAGDVVSGRLTDVSGGKAKVELGEGVAGHCRLPAEKTEAAATVSRSDVSSLGAMLAAKWKTGGGPSAPEAAKPGQVRSFRILSLDAQSKRVELEMM